MFRKRLAKRHKIFIGIIILVVLLNVLAWNSTAFCDAYIAVIFPVWLNTYGRMTGLFPFSVGEWMIAAGVVLVVLVPVAGLLALFAKVLKCGQGILRFAKKFYVFFAWTLVSVSLIMTLNCSILYHASAFSEKYFGQDTKEHSLEELISLYNEMAVQCNQLQAQMPRDERGRVLYIGSVLAPESGFPAESGQSVRMIEMRDKARECMKELGKTYSQLDGYYPRPKPLLSSDFMCQQYMSGYYFPFSLEANYNDVMYVLNKPACMCHELAHLRGYIYEDEANFISYLACVQSEDMYFRYSGYLSVLPYVVNDLSKAQRKNPALFKAAIKEVPLVRLERQVAEDVIFVTPEEWERINRKALIDTETVDKVSDTFVDTSLKLNGVSDGKISYSRVVKLLLQYQEYTSDNS